MNIKSFFEKIGRKISGGFAVIVNVLEELLSRLIHFPDFFFGWILEELYSKKMRLTVVILVKPDGYPTAPKIYVENSIEHAKKTLKSGANIIFEKSEVRIARETAPPYALRVQKGISVFGDLFQAAGEYFRGNSESGDLTVFVIEDVIGGMGYTPFGADFALVDRAGILKGSTLVHEIGHACGLLDWQVKNNFMKTPTSKDANRVNWWQSNTIRSSRHVGYN